MYWFLKDNLMVIFVWCLVYHYRKDKWYIYLYLRHPMLHRLKYYKSFNNSFHNIKTWKIKIFTTLKYFVSTLLKTFPKYPIINIFSMHFSFIIINTKSNFKKIIIWKLKQIYKRHYRLLDLLFPFNTIIFRNNV